MHYIAGLGNPGEEYENTRHNAGRIAALDFIVKKDIDEPEFNKKLNALVSEGKLGKNKFQIILPETFMNKSGLSLKPIIASAKKAKDLIVIHDDVDLPLGKIKISFGRSSGGHKGVESIIKNIKTKDFARIRIGVSKAGVKGKVKKPQGDKFLDFIVGKFKPDELKEIKKASKKVTEALDTLIAEGLNKAMSLYN
ncbi:TPA: aminoacyl-tRNA hydrolase [Patescibacteria group bacterium]|nr:MAG: Peptidyl-tRNA hydrolase [Parcubacteria group bacterium GW2011_GWF2_40_10]KKR47594.1 MAG: Peptidyl-tRNA hydrolase [Parcubacteria group bacterium GW2011_GWA2_40_143]KKR60152.1 MAG: Peptidyl-tRNA hydrolase [Parcubacteria group bacterium GW2011_GWC2_40_31]KKR75448.1 MAG: Peptidyl-tRNA hydrolase [Parcubacteria group bacterium GW2011_GWB2_40_8]KKR76794.1 MAG: Peptidyl-tRNA hydrolase [Parcubacteria group bacterium GW2011_GWE2_40_8]KKR81817.1 MAG: Peptidyl-tRNA hydrolase [Parcubacteria group b